MKKLRILLVDDHALVRRGEKGLLHTQRGWRVVGEAKNGTEAVKKARKLKPDVAIVDISMPDLDGLEVIRQIREAVPNAKSLVLTMHESEQMVRRALEAGALGYILKTDLTESLMKAVRAVSDGKRFLTPKVSEIVLQGYLQPSTQYHQGARAGVRATPRELEIIRLLAEGKSNKEVAALLRIADKTVATHRSNIMVKLGLHSLAELIHYALNRGIAKAQGS
jgi:DNA-binding NarL/FixJ family response regulator